MTSVKLALCALALSGSCCLAQPSPIISPDLSVVAPASLNLHVRWLTPPDAVAGDNSGSIAYADPSGRVWIATDRELRSPSSGPVKLGGIVAMRMLASGELLLVRGRKSVSQIGISAGGEFRPLFDLPPGVTWARFAASGNLYIVVMRPGPEGVALSTLYVARSTVPASAAAYAPAPLEPLFSFTGEIADIAPAGNAVCLAIGNKIIVVGADRQPKLLLQARDRVTSLAASGNGLVYATRFGLDYAGGNGQAGLIASNMGPLQIIQIVGDTLYGYSPRSGGVFALDGAALLASEVLPPPADAASPFRADARFFRTSDDVLEKARKSYATGFDGSVGTIAAELHFAPVDAAAHLVSYRFRLNGNAMPGAEEWADLGAPVSDKPLFIKLPAAPDGGYIPGSYGLELLVDGRPAGHGEFAISGEPSLVQAVRILDVVRVRAALASPPSAKPDPSRETLPDAMVLLLKTMLAPEAGASAGKTAREILDLVLPRYRIDSFPPAMANRFVLICSQYAVTCTPEIVDWLSRNGAGLNGRFANGKTALWLALEAHGYRLAMWLLDHGADPNTLYRKTTPLGYLLHAPEPLPLDSVEVIAKFVALGARIEGVAPDGYVPPIPPALFEQMISQNPAICAAMLVNMPRGIGDATFARVFRKAMADLRASINNARELNDVRSPQAIALIKAMDKALTDRKSPNLRKTLGPPFYFTAAQVYLVGPQEWRPDAVRALQTYLDLAPNGPQAPEAVRLLQMMGLAAPS